MSQTLEKALKVIDAIAAHQPVQVKQLSRTLNIPLPTLYRFITALEAKGYVTRAPGDAKYQLGLSFVRLGALALKPLHLPEIIHPLLREIADQTMESSSLQIRRGLDTICIDCVESPQRVRFSPGIGRISPLYAGAGPRVLLAYMRENEREKAIEGLVLRKIGPKTITDRKQLMRRLREIIKRGYAVSEEELTEGSVGVAVPVFDTSDEVLAALTASGPKFRMKDEQIRKAINVLKRSAAKLSHKLPPDLIESIK